LIRLITVLDFFCALGILIAACKCSLRLKANEVNNEVELEEPLYTIANRPTYWLTRFMILRLLGIVYAIAFLVAINQVIPLIGSNGLTPLEIYLKNVSAALGSDTAGFFRLPSLFWLWHSDAALVTIAWIGFLLSCVVVQALLMHRYSLSSGFFICPLFM